MDITYPREVLNLINDGKALPIFVEGPPSKRCPNCADFHSVFYWEHDKSSRKTKWIELNLTPESIPLPWYHGPGWYPGALHEIPCPVCTDGSIPDLLSSKCGLYLGDLNITLSGFKKLPGKEKALSVAQGLLSMNRSPSGFVFFHGAFGVGKSHLLKSLVNGFRLMGTLSVYYTLANLLAFIRDRYGEGAPHAAEALIEYFRGVKVLCLDEIDRVNLTQWAQETIQRMLDSRYNDRGSILTAMAANCEPDGLPADLDYLASRIKGGIVVQVGGVDMRPVIGAIERKDWE